MSNGTVLVTNDLEEKFTATSIAQFVFLATMFVFAVAGNGLVCYIVYRFKHLRTVPNALIVNLSVIDLFNSLVNMPLFVSFYIFRLDVFKGKWITYVFSSLHNYIIYLNVLTLMALMADRYGAIAFKFRYHSWKTKKKAYRGIALIWVTGTVFLISLGFYRDRILSHYEDLPLMEYRRILYKTGGWKVALALFGAPLVVITVLGGLIWRSVKASRKRIEDLTGRDECTSQGKKMLDLLRKKELQTTRNIIIVVVTYFVCFVPAMALGICLRRDITVPWLEYFAFFCSYLTSACSPIVYSLRTCQFKQVIRELFTPNRNRPVFPVEL